uniref:Microtubule-associated protein n=1 Tax=Nothoprocta perdicaria TaxID=30464 RepID=A0A8C7A5T8_NOTPE
MSVAGEQAAPLGQYSPAGAAARMEAPKELGAGAFEWQRTEGKLHEIGLSVNAAGPGKDGLVKGAGFTDEDKLCFFEGKELKAAPKEQRELEAQGKKYQAAAGHLETWSLLCETFPAADGGSAAPKASDFHWGQAAAPKACAGLAKDEAVTDQEKAAGKAGVESKSVAAAPGGGTGSPGAQPAAPNGSGNGTVRKVEGAKPLLPTTTVELAQDEGRGGGSPVDGAELEEEPEEPWGWAAGAPGRAAQQRKAMRRAMSECSRLSVPLALDLADKYPQPPPGPDVATGLLAPDSSLAQGPAPPLVCSRRQIIVPSQVENKFKHILGFLLLNASRQASDVLPLTQPLPLQVADAKSPEKRSSLSKPPSSVTPRTAVRSSPATPRTTAASPVSASGGAKSSAASPSAPAGSSPSVPAARPKPKAPTTKPAAGTTTTTAAAPADARKAAAKAPPKAGPAAKPPRPAGSVSAPDLKNVRSKIGSTDNIKHQPGGGKVQIVSKKANYSHVQSKCGSKDNIKHVPGGGNVQIQNKKVDLSKVSSKCGSKANIKHKPGGGDVKIENQKLNFKEKAQAKVGSLDSVGHVAAAGAAKVRAGRAGHRGGCSSRCCPSAPGALR